MAERSAAARKRRQRQAIIASAIGVVVIAGAAVWLVSTLKDDKKTTKSTTAAGTVACSWTPATAGGGAQIKDTGGVPPTTVPNIGTDTLTLDTSQGTITATVDRSKAPCTSAAFEYLSAKKFWDNTKCHRLTTEGIKVLQCGDPTATGKGYKPTAGSGGPNFMYAEENLPVGKDPSYPAGTIAMAKTQAAGSTSSQFFIVYEDIPAASLPPQYTVLGTLTAGLDIVKKVAKAGTDSKTGDGHPKLEVDIKSLKMATA